MKTEVYLETLDDLSDHLFRAACKKAIRSEQFYPSPSVILKYAEIVKDQESYERQLKTPALPEAEEKPASPETIARIMKLRRLMSGIGEIK